MGACRCRRRLSRPSAPYPLFKCYALFLESLLKGVGWCASPMLTMSPVGSRNPCLGGLRLASMGCDVSMGRTSIYLEPAVCQAPTFTPTSRCGPEPSGSISVFRWGSQTQGGDLHRQVRLISGPFGSHQFPSPLSPPWTILGSWNHPLLRKKTFATSHHPAWPPPHCRVG